MNFLFRMQPRPEPEPGAALAGLGSELGLEIYQARALESRAKATASRPSRAVTSLNKHLHTIRRTTGEDANGRKENC